VATEDAPVFERQDRLHRVSGEWIQSILAGFASGFTGSRHGLWNWGWKWRGVRVEEFDWGLADYAGCLIGWVWRFEGFVGERFFKYSAS
jgi:hypothetical protein